MNTSMIVYCIVFLLDVLVVDSSMLHNVKCLFINSINIYCIIAARISSDLRNE